MEFFQGLLRFVWEGKVAQKIWSVMEWLFRLGKKSLRYAAEFIKGLELDKRLVRKQRVTTLKCFQGNFVSIAANLDEGVSLLDGIKNSRLGQSKLFQWCCDGVSSCWGKLESVCSPWSAR